MQLDLNMTIVEVDFYHPRPRRRTSMQFLYDENRVSKLYNSYEFWHTVQKLLPGREPAKYRDKMQDGQS
jgi:hypothetical protein